MLKKKDIPNVLSFSRLCLALMIGVLFFIEHELWVAQAVITLAILTDKLDGSLARRWNTVSELGKQLESIIDPVLLLFGSVYLVQFTDFPALIISIGLGFTAIGAIARVITSKKAGRHFYEKSSITRYAVGLGYLVLLCYLFQIPYREWLLWPTLVYGFIVLVNYIRLMRLFLQSAHPMQ